MNVNLDFLIRSFGEQNSHLAHKNKERNTSGVAAWFVSNCDSKSGREIFVKKLKKYVRLFAKLRLAPA